MVAKELTLISKMIINELQAELIGQGHNATGSLVNSFKSRSILLPNSLVIEIAMNRYGGAVDKGRKAGTKKIPLEALMEWIEDRAIASGDTEKKNIAFAIQQKIFQEGSPTKGSFKFSPNGRRKGFIDFVIDNKLQAILATFEDSIFKEFDSLVTEITKDFNKKNK